VRHCDLVRYDHHAGGHNHVELTAADADRYVTADDPSAAVTGPH